ncbi:unnamed protein product [Rhizopus microsporus]
MNSNQEENEPRLNQATYRDLVIFEERLKGNMTRLLKRKRKYEALLVALFIFLAYFFYAVFIDPSKVSDIVNKKSCNDVYILNLYCPFNKHYCLINCSRWSCLLL